MRALLITLLVALLAPAAALAHPDPARTKVAILIFNDVQVIDYSGPLEVLSDAGFDVYTVAETRNPVTTSAGDAVLLTAKYTFSDAPHPDLIVIPGGGFEAAAGSATAAWIRRESGQAAHVMSVCNGAFTLAGTGLLDGLAATTTAGNMNRLRQSYPAIRVAPDQRITDNGKILTTAGLSAGIDGALHMVDKIKGKGAGQAVALAMEYDWRPDQPLVRGLMADRMIPSIYRPLHEAGVNDPFDVRNTGDLTQWERALWYVTPQSPEALFALLSGAFEAGYTAPGGPWVPKSFRLRRTGTTAATFTFDDREARHWSGSLTVRPESEPGQIGWHFSIRRAD